ncbi:hypothetical protein [Amycolatopsis rubida]|uniref:hypothetical protein n=1 Tax=Amycolatopsis rubida TaxID=112413 RepID=UPI00116057E5|nr:hypothetical protein [Amycolatopsis rubida]
MTAGQRGDSPQSGTVPGKGRVARVGGGRARTWPERVLARSSRADRPSLRRRGIVWTIPQPADQVRHRRGQPPAFGPRNRKQQHAIGCRVNRIKRNRAGTVRLAAINEWL